MIPIRPGTKYTLGNPLSNDLQRKRLLSEVERIINPWLDTIVIHNQTKTATVTYSIVNGNTLCITVTNEEEDSKFKLE